MGLFDLVVFFAVSISLVVFLFFFFFFIIILIEVALVDVGLCRWWLSVLLRQWWLCR